MRGSPRRSAGSVAGACLLALLLLAPIASAHIANARPILQRGQFERIIDLQPGGVGVDIDLILRSSSSLQINEPLRHTVTHSIEPALGRFRIEYRPDASIAGTRFDFEWQIERIVEYRDLNVNGRYEPMSDTAVKAWRIPHYDWRRVAINTVQLEDVTGTSVVWEANLTSAPSIRMEVAMAGKDFADEGAIVRPQDVAIYLDILDMPPRSVGSLFAVEIGIRVAEDTTLSFHTAEKTSTALLADAFMRRGLLVWGGEGYLDGLEQRVDATIEDERAENGNRTARLVWHLPSVDRSMRFVLVSGVEYASENRREEPFPWTLALVGLAVAALASRRRP